MPVFAVETVKLAVWAPLVEPKLVPPLVEFVVLLNHWYPVALDAVTVKTVVELWHTFEVAAGCPVIEGAAAETVLFKVIVEAVATPPPDIVIVLLALPAEAIAFSLTYIVVGP